GFRLRASGFGLQPQGPDLEIRIISPLLRGRLGTWHQMVRSSQLRPELFPRRPSDIRDSLTRTKHLPELRSTKGLHALRWFQPAVVPKTWARKWSRRNRHPWSRRLLRWDAAILVCRAGGRSWCLEQRTQQL